MLESIRAIRFDGRVQTGRTTPCRLTCQSKDKSEIEVVAKFSAACDRKETALAMEAVAAMLAADLDLPVPEPFLVAVEEGFIESLPDTVVADLVRRSVAVAFGSKHLPSGYTSWPIGKAVPREAFMTAAEIFAFDALIAHDDRRPQNPNCLFKGASLAIYDHEMAFFTEGILGWKPPWIPGALETLRQQGRHLFYEQLRGKPLNLSRFSGAWLAITNERLAEYRAALPKEWDAAAAQAEQALNYIGQVRDNIERALQEVARVLS